MATASRLLDRCLFHPWYSQTLLVSLFTPDGIACGAYAVAPYNRYNPKTMSILGLSAMDDPKTRSILGLSAMDGLKTRSILELSALESRKTRRVWVVSALESCKTRRVWVVSALRSCKTRRVWVLSAPESCKTRSILMVSVLRGWKTRQKRGIPEVGMPFSDRRDRPSLTDYLLEAYNWLSIMSRTGPRAPTRTILPSESTKKQAGTPIMPYTLLAMPWMPSGQRSCVQEGLS